MSPAGGLDLEGLEAEAVQQSQAVDPRYFAPELVLLLVRECRALRTALRRIEICAKYAGAEGHGDYRDIEADASMALARGAPQGEHA